MAPPSPIMTAASTSSDRQGIPTWQFCLLLAALVVAAFPQVIFGAATFVARDYGFFAYPLAHFQKDCFWRGELPFWDPYNNCGVPFLAQWNTLPLYPPALVYLLLPLPWSLSFFTLLHLWFAGVGMYFLARNWTGNSNAAAFAGAVFAFNGFTLNLLMWPSHIATFSWLPWVVLAAQNAWRFGGKQIPLAAATGALQMLAGGPETIFLTWLIVSALWAQDLVTTKGPRLPILLRHPLVVGLVFALSAAQLLPFLDLVAHAQRETGYTDLRWSMPATGWANFLVPLAFGSTATEGIFFQHGQYWTSSYYLGTAALWLAVCAAFWSRDRRGRLLVVAACIALLCALGSNTPIYPFIRKVIPQLSFITYPIKFVMVLVFVAPLLAAFALAAFMTPSPDVARMKSRSLAVGALLLLLILTVLIWTQSFSAPGDDAPAALLSASSRAGFLILSGAILFGLQTLAKSSAARWLPLLLILVAWLDVVTHQPHQNPTVPPAVYRQNLIRDGLAMNPQPALGESRAMLSPGAALELTRFAVSDARNNFLAKRTGFCADANILDGVPKVDGFFSLTPSEFDGLLSAIYNVKNSDWLALENFMGVSQYTSATNVLVWQPRPGFLPWITAGQRVVFLPDTNALWEFSQNNFDGNHVVFLSPVAQPLVTNVAPAAATITDTRFSVNTLDFQIHAAAPTVAVIAQTFYHCWQAEVDGRPVPLLRANIAFQALPVPAGRHYIHLAYRDRAFQIGAAVSLCIWINCAVAYLALRRRDHALRELQTTP